MAKWDSLKSAISEAITANGNQEITGLLLQQTLLSIVDSIGENATYVGAASPSTTPGTLAGPVCYLASTPGTYVNFGNLIVNKAEIALLKWDGYIWTKTSYTFSDGSITRNLIADGSISMDKLTTALQMIIDDKLASTNIVQEIGDGENVVMSQKAVTRELTELESNIAYGEITNDYYINYMNGVALEFIGLKYVTKQVTPGMRLLYHQVSTTLDSRGLAFYDKSGAFIGGYQALLETQEIVVPDNAVICKATVRSSDDAFLYAYNDAIAELNEKIDVEKVESNNNLLTAFSNLVCVGDSLTYSQVYVSASGSRQARVTYPEALARLCGNQYTILARAGATALACWDEFNSQIETKENALAIIYLGTNYGMTDSLDTDVVGDNPDEWAENNTGAYCRFVQKFLSLGYKVLLLRIWATSGSGDTSLANTNSAITHIAERFEVAVMDVPVSKATIYHYYPDLSGTNGVHYNDLGYSWFANRLIEKVGQLGEEQLKFLLPNA